MKGKKNWIIYGSLMISVVIGSGFLAGELGSWLKGWEEYGYLGIFLGSFVANSTIILPLPFLGITFPLAIGLASQVDLFSVAITYALGATFGEGVGYVLGLTGKKIIKLEERAFYRKVEERLKRSGFWARNGAIAFLSFLFLFPFDIVGIVTGTIRYPFWEFLVFCFLGRVLKYLFLIISGAEIGKVFFI